MAKEVPSGTSFHLHKNVGLNVGLFMIFDRNTYYVVVLLIKSKKHSEFTSRYKRIKARRGHKKAIIAICPV